MKPRINKLGDKNIIGEKITKLRVSKGISQREFIARLQTNGADINPSSVSKLEGQTRQVIDKEIKAIAESLEVSILDLFQD